MKTLSWSKDLILNAAVCFSGTHAVVRIAKETVVTSGSRVKRVLTWAMSKWRKTLNFNEEEDEDTLVDVRPQIERGTVFRRDTCHREIHQRSIRDKRNPREAFFDLGDVKVENVIVASMKRRMKTLSWRKDLKLNAARCCTGMPT